MYCPGSAVMIMKTLQVRLLADTDHVVPQYGAVIKDVGRTYAGSFNMSGLKESNLFLLKTIAESPKTCLFCGILLFFLIWFLLSDVKWYHKLEFLLAYAGAYIILFLFCVYRKDSAQSYQFCDLCSDGNCYAVLPDGTVERILSCAPVGKTDFLRAAVCNCDD